MSDKIHCIYCGADTEHTRSWCRGPGGRHEFRHDIVGEQLARGPILRTRSYSDDQWATIEGIAHEIFIRRRGSISDPGLERSDARHMPALVKTVAQNTLFEALLYYEAFLELKEE